MKVKVKNEGNCAAFFKLCVKNQDQMYQFVLAKGQEKRLKVRLNDNVSNVSMFYGPEITRQICKSLQRTYSSHVFTNPEFSISNCFFE